MKKLTLKSAAHALTSRIKYTAQVSGAANKGDDGIGQYGYQAGYGDVKKGANLQKGGVQSAGSSPEQSNKSGLSAAAPMRKFSFPQNPTTPGKIVSHVKGGMSEAAKVLLARRAA